MCHSVDMYMPEVTRRAAEERIREASAAGAAREQWLVDMVFALAARAKGWLGRTPLERATQERMEHG